MEQIIQLKSSEYHELVRISNLNEESIQRKAQELYKEKGTYGIKLELNVQQDYQDEITFTANSYVKDWGDKFPLSDDDKRKIVKFVNSRSNRMMIKKFGHQINNVNFYHKELESLGKIRLWSITFTLTGWLLAALFLVIVFMK